ncbi:MAG: polysaccharide pyruvyl transferase family protein [Corynebacterium sp.]|uniref:polysaccharide pyruvyl transferase family protein n=1 Tax=Corynebacterium sp. TaxID=1720 RepID=UPI0026E06D56|nr:polysaccharide pyruvyl transferase family protein [Corynebacterium sp.]MDO5669420.1 polysaccharide pyruvyl transferase family protein [Corynebacterium sp.]
MSDVIYLVAPAGFPNFGDEFIVSAWLREIAYRRPRARVILDCHSPGPAAILHHNVHPDLTVTDTLWRLIDACSTEAEVRAAVADPSRVPALVTGLNLAKSAALVHVLGGGWINDTWPQHTRLIAAVGALEGRKVATGQGLHPGTQVAERLDWSAFELLTVRDTPSLALADALPAPDDSWLAATDPQARHGLGHGPEDARLRGTVVSAQSDLLGIGVDELAGRLVRQLRELGTTGDDLAFVECIPAGDWQVWDAMCRLDPQLTAGARFVGFDELWAHGLPARAGQTWLSTRFHPHLIAAARGARGIAVAAHEGDYYRVKHESVGSGWPVSTLVEPTQPGEGVADAAERRLAAESTAERLYPAARRERWRREAKRVLRRG